MKSKFVHLHVHSEYSLLDGLPKTKRLAAYIKELGMEAVALTDHGAMYGVIEFYKNCKEAGIKPIIGMEGYITNVNRKVRGERSKIKNYHLLLLAKNNQGYRNLMKLTTIAHVEGYYYRPRIDHETLEKYHEGLICTSGCGSGEIPSLLTQGDYKEAKKKAEWYLRLFGDDLYFELQRHEVEKYVQKAEDKEIKRELTEQARMEKIRNEGIVKLSRELGVAIIATNDCHYVKKEDAVAQDALVCVATGKNMADTKRMRFIDVPDYYIKTIEEMEKLYLDLPDACENTVKVAKKCEVEIELGKFYFPEIVLPKGVTAKEQLIKKANAGLKARYGKINKELRKRLDYELGVINDKGYAAYFLIYQDMADWAHKRLVPINIRGSVAGSLVSYVLGITTVDPIRFNLPFERFLNPFRPSAPDIDLDIADDKRGEMIAYLTQKYGKEKVAQICTFGRMLARGSVRDTARVLGYPYGTGDRIAKLVPMGSQGFPMTLLRALDECNELRDIYNTDQDAKKILDLARQIEGNARHVSVHAGGVVIAPGCLNEFVPLQLDTSDEKKLITQYEMHACEDVGLVKLDILGIRNLSILREAVEKVKETTGKVIDLKNLPLDDKKTYEMLSKGETMGVFQLSGSGMTRYLVELQPEKIEDIMMMIALFRPGPMRNIDEYIARKRGQKKVSYYHPKMEKFLDKSLGVLVYQDDLLYTALEVAGYDWMEVDKFRKAVGKKIPEEMARQHTRFVEGCIEHSEMSKKQAEGLWELFEPFQGYGFNKAHSASYGMVAYQTAYLKANYPVAYMTALLTAESRDKDKISAGVNECRRMGIIVLPPDINESDVAFTIVENKKSLNGKGIRFGLSAIKNVGVAAIEAILAARETGQFNSLPEFFSRVDNRKVNKKVVESLIKVGAMERFGKRAALLNIMDEVRARVKPQQNNGQQGLFSAEDEKNLISGGGGQMTMITEGKEFSEEELTNLERQLLGFSLTAKPLNELIEKLVKHRTHKINEIIAEEIGESGGVKIAGVVAEVRVVITRKTGAEMAFVKIEDETGAVDAVVFPRLYGQTKEVWIEYNPILISGSVDLREERPTVIVESIGTVEEMGTGEGTIKISVPNNIDRQGLLRIKKLFEEHQGESEASLVWDDGRELKLPIKVDWSEELSREVAAIIDLVEVN